jgi:hypothetical protein
MPVSIEPRYLQRQRAELERERPKEGEAPWKGDVGGHPARNTAAACWSSAGPSGP